MSDKSSLAGKRKRAAMRRDQPDAVRSSMKAVAAHRPRVLCHEYRRSKRRCATVREMKEGPSGSAIRSLIPSHRELLWSKAVVVSVAETPGQ